MDETLDRRRFGAIAVGAAAAAAATAASPALAQPMRMGMGGMPGVGMLTAGDWMQQVRAQHMAVDRQFAMLRRTRDGDGAMRDRGLKDLATMLTAHSVAEEVALYPGIAMSGDRQGSDRLYMEQSHAKVMIAELDAMPRNGPAFMGRLMALEAAIKAHVAEEENDLYPRLMRSAGPRMNAKMTQDFRREFTRYIA